MKHSWFGINTFNVGLFEVNTATFYQQTISDRIVLPGELI